MQSICVTTDAVVSPVRLYLDTKKKIGHYLLRSFNQTIQISMGYFHTEIYKLSLGNLFF